MTFPTATWMDLVGGSKLLSELSIPGTHDSGSRYIDGTTLPVGSKGIRLTTQTDSIREQLDAGIRFLDIRVGFTDGEFLLYHEDVSLNLSFGEVRDICRAFLLSNPRETIIMSLKLEEEAPDSNRGGKTFQGRFDDYVAETPTLWYLENTIPKLSDARKKIVLFRRFDATGTLGINAVDGFPDDTTGTTTGSPKLRIQDQFNQAATSKETKYTAVKDLLNEASEPETAANRGALFLNFSSAAGAGSVANDFPLSVANFINPRLVNYFNGKTTGRFGIVAMDFQTTVLNTLIIRTNVNNAGYWVVDGDAVVSALGTAPDFFPSGPAAPPGAIAIAARPSGTGYYLLMLDGKVFAYGDATHAGEGVPAGTNAVSIAVKPITDASSDSPLLSALGYWILASNGMVSAYNATAYPQVPQSEQVEAVSIVATRNGSGYWILMTNGKVVARGNAGKYGDRSNQGGPYVGMARTADGSGYWILESNGDVHAFGTASKTLGQGVSPGATARAIAATRDGAGYWILSTDGNVHAYGSANFVGRATPRTVAVGIAVSSP
ncbi:MAG TPA: phosphatidylinositol-specific phospholipase C [Longimicrobium sp.]|nr:phosphatidylinositol-specific phospholipase C [Longimicrobium sp.]